MYCSSCGQWVDEGRQYCPSCGAKVGSFGTEGQQGSVNVPGSVGGLGYPNTEHKLPTQVLEKTELQVPYSDSRGTSETFGYVPTAALVPARSKHQNWIIPVLVAIILLSLVGIVIVLDPLSLWSSSSPEIEVNTEANDDDTGGTTVDSDSSGSSDDDTSSTPVARSSVNDYSWEELSAISDMIVRASSNEEGLAIAKQYNLCNSDGSLDGSQSKSFQLTDGSSVQAQIVGFRHDTKTSGGLAGITFITQDCVDTARMNSTDDNSGGWKSSSLRTWLNSSLYDTLPDDLAEYVVTVDKYTNNKGNTTQSSSVTVSSDKLWLPSFTELAGYVSVEEWLAGGVPSEQAYIAAVYAAEGDQYQLFSDLGVDWDGTNRVLQKSVGYVASQWWTRTPMPSGSQYFRVVETDGNPRNNLLADGIAGVAFGFCL